MATGKHPLLRATTAALLATFIGMASCSLLVDGDDLSSSRCTAEEKLCDDGCAQLVDPSHGCGTETCNPCSISNATARCTAEGTCGISICHAGFGNCDADASNGCETNLLTDPDHCGDCDQSCPERPHSVRGCDGHSCAIWQCESGYRDCNGELTDGCECGPGGSCGSSGECVLGT